MIIIHAQGNNSIGIGNLSRAYEIVCYLEKFITIIGIFECDDKLFKRYHKSNIFQSFSQKDSLNLIKNNNCLTYISDLLSPSKELSNELKKIGIKRIFHFNGLENGFEPDVLFVTDGFDYEINLPNVKIYRGFEYYVISQEILLNRRKFIPKKNIENVLISFGGADPAFFTEYFAENINDTKYNYTIVLGPSMSNERKEHIKSIQKNNVVYIDSPSSLCKLLLESDLLLTLGGMSTYEAMCLGVPVCAIRWSYLAYVVKSFGEKQMISDLGDIKDAYSNLLNLQVQNINDIAQNAFNIIDGKSLKNIKDVILNESLNICK